jgi:subtilisin family serine protease
MTMNYREDRILVAASEFRPGDVDRLNQVLADAALGRPLRDPAAGSAAADQGGLIRIPVSGADPLAIRETVRAHVQQRGGELPTLIADFNSTAGTTDPGMFFAAGKKSGHGVAAWLPAPEDEMPPRPSWAPSADPPVIALLDSGVHPHDWLPPKGGPPFVIDAAALELGWHSPVPEDQPAKQPYPPGSHWGHGTFIAGLIRQAAPGAQILSMRVMDSVGQVADSAVACALHWLADHAHDVPVDIVLMAFGRRREQPHDHGLKQVRKAISRVAAIPGLKIVASAGNDGSTEPVYPAAFAVDDDLSSTMVSVGSRLSESQWAPYSNRGPWVLEARNGTNTVSTHPQTFHGAGQHQVAQPPITDLHDMVPDPNAFAWWSGTSFAAAIYAGQLAGARPGGQGLP